MFHIACDLPLCTKFGTLYAYYAFLIYSSYKIENYFPAILHIDQHMKYKVSQKYKNHEQSLHSTYEVYGWYGPIKTISGSRTRYLKGSN